MHSIMLHLPYPPSANRLWVRARKGMRKSDAYCAWLTEAGWKARAQKPKPLTGAYKLSLHVARPPGQRFIDLDNFIKPVGDLLQSLRLIENDKLCEMVLARWVSAGGTGLTVIVESAATEHAVA